MGVIQSNKTASKDIIKRGETLDVTLSLTASPAIMANPKDVVLILDRSGSMNGAPFTAMKSGAKHFVDVLDKSTDGSLNNVIGLGSRVGVVGFDTVASIEKSLSSSSPNIKRSIDGLVVTGTTNHEDAFIKGREVLNVGGSNGKVMVLFTDGNSNGGKEGYDIAAAAKAEGTTIYCIGLGTNVDMTAMEKWASAPASDHILIAPTYQDINDAFDELAARISTPPATDIELIDTINTCFEVVSVGVPTSGTARKVDATHVAWNVASLGAKELETASVTFTIKHVGDCMGIVPINTAASYNDKEGNTIMLPNPNVEIVDTTVDVKEDCPTPVTVTGDACKDYIAINAGDIVLDNIGRILEISTTIKDVCPNKQVALAVLVSEVDTTGVEHSRGMKTLVIPPHTNLVCMDVKVNCIKFVLPEALDAQGSPTSMCNDRVFNVRFVANYIDSDYECCKQ